MAKLRLPVDNAQQLLLREQIEKAKAIHESAIESAEQTWYDYNVTLLRALFDDDALIGEYNAEREPTSSTSGSALDQAGRRRVSYRYSWLLQEAVERQTNFLISLYGRVPLFPLLPSMTDGTSADVPFVALDHIAALKRIKPDVTHYDTARLVALCEELNRAWEQRMYQATAILIRAIMDHVPPLFACISFENIASNYPGTRSFKDLMNVLQTSARKIADFILHTPIRSREMLPTASEVHFAASLNALLGEIVRKHAV